MFRWIIRRYNRTVSGSRLPSSFIHSMIIINFTASVIVGGVGIYHTINGDSYKGLVLNVAGAAAISVGTIVGIVVMHVLSRNQKTDGVSLLTYLYLRQKSREFSMSIVILMMILLLTFVADFKQLSVLTTCMLLAVSLAHFLTIYRIRVGSFGYNASEMGELLSYITTRADDGGVPPNLRGLAPHPDFKRSVQAQDKLAGLPQ